MPEIRKHQRIELEVRVASKDNRIRGFTRNLSVGGCLIDKSDDFNLLPIGSKTSFFLEIPGEYAYIEIDGVAKHHGKEGDGMGICFETTNGIKSLIDQFLRNYLEKGGDYKDKGVKEGSLTAHLTC